MKTNLPLILKALLVASLSCLSVFACANEYNDTTDTGDCCGVQINLQADFTALPELSREGHERRFHWHYRKDGDDTIISIGRKIARGDLGEEGLTEAVRVSRDTVTVIGRPSVFNMVVLCDVLQSNNWTPDHLFGSDAFMRAMSHELRQRGINWGHQTVIMSFGGARSLVPATRFAVDADMMDEDSADRSGAIENVR
jgi:hypothetical protein